MRNELIFLFVLPVCLALSGCNGVSEAISGAGQAASKPCVKIEQITINASNSPVTIDGTQCNEITEEGQGNVNDSIDTGQDVIGYAIPIEGGINANSISTEPTICNPNDPSISYKTCLANGGQPQPVESEE